MTEIYLNRLNPHPLPGDAYPLKPWTIIEFSDGQRAIIDQEGLQGLPRNTTNALYMTGAKISPRRVPSIVQQGMWRVVSTMRQAGIDLSEPPRPHLCFNPDRFNAVINEMNTEDRIDDQPEKAKTELLVPGVEQVPFEGIEAIGSIFSEGAVKYGVDNWKKGIGDREYQTERCRHAIRHLMLWANGDRSENHLAKVAWFCVTQIWTERNQQKLAD